mmetsp:Transcript_39225/g.28371  ORF Transcript_39225/g.28371 Transcript_39225/m.28371 type:complete len:134 (-) Transcript_39225:744-1145(-)
MIERILPRKITSGEQFMQIHKGSLFNDNDKETVDLDAFNHGINKVSYDLLDRGGKRWRPLLGLMLAECQGRNIEDVQGCKDIYYTCGLTEIFHNASLMVDDIEDSSEKRRGDLCTYKKFGIDYAINTGNYMYF